MNEEMISQMSHFGHFDHFQAWSPRVKFFSFSLFSRNESEKEMTGNRDREVKMK